MAEQSSTVVGGGGMTGGGGMAEQVSEVRGGGVIGEHDNAFVSDFISFMLRPRGLPVQMPG